METTLANRVWHRLYSDFLMPSRLEEYRSLIQYALQNGYQVCSVRSFWRLAQRGLAPGARCLVVRCDVDTDPSTAQALFQINRELGTSCSFYFRLKTVEISLMQAIERCGGESSYHFEEIATYAKRLGLTSRAQVGNHMRQIREEFATNLTHLRELTGLPMVTLAAHGDFTNRRLGMPSCELLDEKLRTQLGIEVEVYDEVISKLFTSRYSDTLYPDFWKPHSPVHAMEGNQQVIHVLVHPRHWRSNLSENIRDNAVRMWEGLQYGRGMRNPVNAFPESRKDTVK